MPIVTGIMLRGDQDFLSRCCRFLVLLSLYKITKLLFMLQIELISHADKETFHFDSFDCV